MMSVLLSWPQAHAAGTAQVGGKAWNLSRLSRYGFAVPMGGVLTVAAWRAFADHNRIDAATATPEQVTAGEMPPALAADIVDGLTRLGLSGTAVAVRSSAVAEDGATASFAGIHDSVLNVTGEAAMLKAVRTCWASAFSERARAYRHRMGLEEDGIAPAVIVQELVVPVAAGVAFTVDPASGRQDRVMVAANRGLGETVVAGSAEPDQYLVDCGFHHHSLSVLSRQVGRKQCRVVPAAGGGTATQENGAEDGLCLDDAQVLDIAAVALRVRWALGHDEVDQDVEWVWDGRQVWVVQARPVTARPRWTYDALRDQPELWSNGNLRDGIPMVMSPMTWSLTANPLHHLLPVQHRAGGAKPMPGLCRMRLIDGRSYLDAAVMQWECWDNFGIDPDLFNRFIGGHQPAIAVPPSSWRKRLARLRANLRLGRAMTAARKHAEDEFAHLRALVDDMRNQDVAVLTDAALVDRLIQFTDSGDRITRLALLLMGSGFTLFILRPLLERFLPGRGDAIAHALLGDSATITSAEHGRALAELAQAAAAEGADPAAWASLPPTSAFRRGMEDFLDRWGHRAVYELELANPRWREDQSWLVDTIRALMAAPPQPRGRGATLAAQAWAEVERAVPRLLVPWIRRLAAQAGRDAAQREEAKSGFVRVYEPVRTAVVEIGRRLADRGVLARRDDVFLLMWEEAKLLLSGHWSGEGARALVADRAERAERLARRPAADVVVVDGGRHRPQNAAAGSGPELTGCAAASGQARGRARVILHPHDGHRLQPGEILVAPSTDPAWTPLFLRAAAVVMETGGLLSHGAIVAREYGLPAVVNVQGVLTRLQDGMVLLVDGDRGVVRIEEE